MVKDKYVLEKEIEVLNESKGIDKFDYQISVSIYVGLLILMTSLVALFWSKSNLTFTSIAFIWILLFLGITSHNYFTRFRNIKNDFKKKHKMVRKRYKKLDIDLSSLEREFKKTSLK